VGLAFPQYSNAQQQPISDLYLFEGLAINPAYAGTPVQFSATAIYRDQWANFPGAPKTGFLAVHSSFMRNKIGAGLIVTSDKIGIHEDYGLYGVYSYIIKMKNANLSMGLQAGFNTISSDFNLLNLKDQNDQLLQGKVSTFNPNFGVGALYYNDKSFIGFSVPCLLASDIVQVEGVLSEAKRYRYYYLNGGTTIDLSHQVKFKPAAMVRFQEQAPLTFDLNSTFVFYETAAAGLSYRWDDSITLLFELKLHENLHMGYGYNHTLSDITKYSNGTHEIMINYRYRIPILHKGLLCPSYF
jgi:type IX secretion system PorP/SprF family membrane protein